MKLIWAFAVLAAGFVGVTACKERTFGESNASSSNSRIRKVEFKVGEVKGQIHTLNGLKISVREAFLECFFTDGSGAVQRRPRTDLKFELKPSVVPVGGTDSSYDITLGSGSVKYSAVFSALDSCRYVLQVEKEGDDTVGADVEVVELSALEVTENPDATQRVSAKLKSLSVKEINTVIVVHEP